MTGFFHAQSRHQHRLLQRQGDHAGGIFNPLERSSSPRGKLSRSAESHPLVEEPSRVAQVDGHRQRRQAPSEHQQRHRAHLRRGGAEAHTPQRERRGLPRRRGPRRLHGGRRRQIVTNLRRQQVRDGHRRVFRAAAARMDLPLDAIHLSRPDEQGPPALGALLGLHEERLHPQAQQGRGGQARHRAVASPT